MSNYLVTYDLGGGTTEICILSAESQEDAEAQVIAIRSEPSFKIGPKVIMSANVKSHTVSRQPTQQEVENNPVTKALKEMRRRGHI